MTKRHDSHSGRRLIVTCIAGGAAAIAVGLTAKLLIDLFLLAVESGHRDAATAVAAAVAVVLVAFAPWLESIWRNPRSPSSWRLRFSLKTLLWTFTILAVYLAGWAPQQGNVRRARAEARNWQRRAEICEQMYGNAVSEIFAERTARQDAEARLKELLGSNGE